MLGTRCAVRVARSPAAHSTGGTCTAPDFLSINLSLLCQPAAYCVCRPGGARGEPRAGAARPGQGRPRQQGQGHRGRGRHARGAGRARGGLRRARLAPLGARREGARARGPAAGLPVVLTRDAVWCEQPLPSGCASCGAGCMGQRLCRGALAPVSARKRMCKPGGDVYGRVCCSGSPRDPQ